MEEDLIIYLLVCLNVYFICLWKRERERCGEGMGACGDSEGEGEGRGDVFPESP